MNLRESTMLMMFEQDIPRWRKHVDALEPTIAGLQINARAIIQPVRDTNAWQGWAMTDITPAVALAARPIAPGTSIVIDLGEHAVGQLHVEADFADTANACIEVQLGEVLAEVCDDPGNDYFEKGRRWLKPITLRCKNGSAVDKRRAVQFVRLTVPADSAPVHVHRIYMQQHTSATADCSSLPEHTPPLLRAIDEVSIRTLRNCMQGVYEDGPKRDRRLWLGDLRLQAMASDVSLVNHDLVKRCLYIHALGVRKDGTVASCVFEKPDWHIGNEFIPDYALLFGDVLLRYAQSSGDWDTARDLWPVALRQTVLCDRCFDKRNLFHNPDDLWLFIDWHDELDRQAAEQATTIYGLRSLENLARELGHHDEAARLATRRKQLTLAAREHLYDADFGLVVSGKSKQISWASQVWMILAGVLTRSEAQRAFNLLDQREDALRPITPYLYHHVVEAMVQCGLSDRARHLVEWYWGGMVKHGATTFWEVYKPDDHFLSPYGSHLHNSYCHAWSCTPSWFIRKGLLTMDVATPEQLDVTVSGSNVAWQR